jgi:hypothetical protein
MDCKRRLPRSGRLNGLVTEGEQEAAAAVQRRKHACMIAWRMHAWHVQSSTHTHTDARTHACTAAAPGLM